MRRSYEGAAQAAALTSALGNSTADLVIQCSDLTNWPTGTGDRPFFVVIDRGKASEEKILCASRSGNTIAVYDDGISNGRGADDTSITSHGVNAEIEHIFTATDADEANAHVNNVTSAHGLTIADVVTTAGTQTLINKTLTSPSITGGALSGSTSIGNVTFTGTVTGFPFIPIGVVSSALSGYSTTDADAGKLIQMTASLSNGVQLHNSAPVGTVILISRSGTGLTTLSAEAGGKVDATPGLVLRAQFSVACAVKVSSTVWLAYGDLAT